MKSIITNHMKFNIAKSIVHDLLLNELITLQEFNIIIEKLSYEHKNKKKQ